MNGYSGGFVQTNSHSRLYGMQHLMQALKISYANGSTSCFLYARYYLQPRRDSSTAHCLFRFQEMAHVCPQEQGVGDVPVVLAIRMAFIPVNILSSTATEKLKWATITTENATFSDITCTT